MSMQVILDSSFPRPGSGGGKKGEFGDWTRVPIRTAFPAFWSESNFRAVPNAEETSFKETLTLRGLQFVECGIYSFIQLFTIL